jgi:hypothetical protein
VSKLVFVDANGKKVAEGSEEAAFQFQEGDERLDKFRTAVKNREAIRAGRPIPDSDAGRAEEDDGTVERVERKR